MQFVEFFHEHTFMSRLTGVYIFNLFNIWEDKRGTVPGMYLLDPAVSVASFPPISGFRPNVLVKLLICHGFHVIRHQTCIGADALDLLENEYSESDPIRRYF